MAVTQHEWAAVLYTLGFLAQIGGGVSVARAAFGVRKVRGMPSLVTHDDGTFTVSSDQTDALVEAQALPIWSLVVLATGIVAGFVASMLSLSL